MFMVVKNIPSNSQVSLPADVLWGSFVCVGEKWMCGKRTPKDVCGKAIDKSYYNITEKQTKNEE